MINALLGGILGILSVVIKIIFSPIDALLNAFIPDLAGSYDSYIVPVVNTVQLVIGHVFDGSLINSSLWALVLTTFIAYVNLAQTVSLIQGAINWVKKVKFW